MISDSGDFLKGYFNVSPQFFLALFTTEAGFVKYTFERGYPLHRINRLRTRRAHLLTSWLELGKKLSLFKKPTCNLCFQFKIKHILKHDVKKFKLDINQQINC